MPVLKITSKRNVYEKKNVCFSQYLKAGFFRIVTFSGRLFPTACEYSRVVVPLTKIKIKTLKLSVTKNLS